MDIKALKDKILQLAIQGKLVEQDPDDEPASVLFNKILKEKKKLIKENNIRKQKSLPAIKENEIPYQLPQNWKWVRLGEISLVNMGQSPKGNTVNDKYGVEFHQGKVFFGEKYINKGDKYTIDPKKIANKDDVIISVRAPVGNVNITEREICIGRGLCAVSSLGTIQKEYYYYFIMALKDYLVNKATGTTFLAVTATTINEMPIPLPPIDEQKRIVDKVDELFTLIDKLDSDKEELLETINKIRNKILQEAIQGNLVPQDDNDEPASELIKKIEKEKKRLIKEKKIKKSKPLPNITKGEIPFELPNGWEWVRLGELINVSSGKGLTKSEMNEDGGVPVYGGNGVTGYHDRANVTKQTIVIGRVGYNCGSVHLTQANSWVTDNAFITTYPEENIDRDWLILLLKGTNLKENKNATAQPVISGKKIYPIIVPLPPLAEQKRIVNKVEKLMALCDQLEKQLVVEEK